MSDGEFRGQKKTENNNLEFRDRAGKRRSERSSRRAPEAPTPLSPRLDSTRLPRSNPLACVYSSLCVKGEPISAPITRKPSLFTRLPLPAFTLSPHPLPPIASTQHARNHKHQARQQRTRTSTLCFICTFKYRIQSIHTNM